jgi:hypothetical protein
MSSYTTRVELHRASDADYENLHVAMKREGFSRLIKSSDGTTYRLPPAEYNYVGDGNVDQVLAGAQRAAETTHLRHAVLVTESNGRRWFALETV